MADNPRKWDDLTPAEKAAWFDGSIRYWEGLKEAERKRKLAEISKRRQGQSRHKKKRWWNH
jgi:hypothetical protein